MRRCARMIAGFSLVICVAMVGLWIVSARYALWVEFSWQDWPTSLNTDTGRLELFQGSGDDPLWRASFHRMNDASSAVVIQTVFAGMTVPSVDVDQWTWHGSFPIGWIVALTAVAPGCWIASAVKTRGRLKGGRCSICGYDLRATPDRCPECGKPVGSAKITVS